MELLTFIQKLYRIEAEIANQYGIICTVKAIGLNPYHYLLKIFTDLPNTKTPEDVEALLPWSVTLPAE